ncbi:beta-ketoacyl-ACP synthase III [Coralliovum pocilloporae]|uniref:beta-ketoacyl-ACP synthase III n=1 Tax=Coralliovum pocilloporae TaxID=3066369 RepID=UPI0033074C85
MSAGVHMCGFGHSVPDRAIPSAEIEARLGLDPGWIERRSGIVGRHYASDHESLTDMALPAAQQALSDAGIDTGEIGLLLLATSTPDHLLPPSAPLLAHRLGLSHPGAVDITGACGGFLYALSFAEGFVRAQQKSALVVAANILSRRINEQERASAILFADAAGAVVLKPHSSSERGMRAFELCSDGAGYDLIKIPVGGTRHPYDRPHAPEDRMMHIENGQQVFAKAVSMMANSGSAVLERADVAPEAVNHFVPHQANRRMFDKVAEKIRLPKDRVRSSVERYGNSSAATIPLTLSLIHHEQKLLRSGDHVLMSAAGAGMTGGSALWVL